MQPLEKTLRNKLESTIQEARDIAEKGAYASLNRLGVSDSEAPAYLNPEERELRCKLRAHARQLGDELDSQKSIQSIGLLVEEMAYEHWNRMLFARFLIENNLLMHPEYRVAVGLEELEDLAGAEGLSNAWELAARYASLMLPQIFRQDSPVFQISQPPEHQQKMEKLLANLPVEVFCASDSLGWAYQFWQSKKKEEVNKSEVKIGARELPAVTQLFTEPYMVSFLLDNSLGAWWAKKRLSAADWQQAENEAELRSKAAIPGVSLPYLRFVAKEGGGWEPAAGVHDNWPEHLGEMKILDPCCGSGHFLVAAFLMLVPMRMELEGLSAQEATAAVLQENLHGLELDRRCVELAAFALAFAAWKYKDSGGYRVLPELNIACSGLAVGADKGEWGRLGLPRPTLKLAFEYLHNTFTHAPTLGSLLEPEKTTGANLLRSEGLAWDDVNRKLAQVFSLEKNDTERENAVAAHGIVRATAILARKYQWVITNVPYLARGKQAEVLKDFCEKHYPEAKNDLATVFLERCLRLVTGAVGGTVSVVLPQNWLFLTTYKKFREKLLRENTWHLIARLGAGGFETISGEVVKAVLLTISQGIKLKNRDSNKISGLDVADLRSAADKDAGLIQAEIKRVGQAQQLDNPDARVTLEEGDSFELLSNYSNSYQGIATADYSHFGRTFWEIDVIDNECWIFQQGTVKKMCYFSGKENLLYWESGLGELANSSFARIQGLEAWTKCGIAVAQMREIPITFHVYSSFDNNVAVIIPNNESHLPAIWCFCSSPQYNEAVRRIDQKLNVTNATLVKVPFDLEYWTEVAGKEYPHGLPEPYSDDPTQWIFHGHPCGSVVWDEEKKWTTDGPLRSDSTVLQVAMARLLGYRWPAELDEKMQLCSEQREWVQRCDSLLSYADSDGIVCIPAVRGEESAAERLFEILAAAYGNAWTNDILGQLLKNADYAGKNLENWLRDGFFTQHCKLFQQRPFIWQIWDGLPDGFSALLNYHRLTTKMLENLIYNYLGDWCNRQKQDIENKVEGAEERLAAAQNLSKKLELILEGEKPYDIFVRWKKLSEQPVGWNPDLNDGVRLNIRPFMTVADVRKKGAGILRDKFNIKWEKDRGKDVETAPWYNLFKGERINDHHLSLEEKTTN
jgi:hypothetical protein